MLPNPLIIRAYVTRGVQLWVGARILFGGVLALATMDPVHLTFSATMLMIGLSTALGIADIVRRHERAFLENLGVSRAALVACFAGPAMLGEIAISLTALVHR